MTVVSYDSAKMQSAIRAYNDILKNVESIRSDMASEVSKIKENWKGDDANNAESDLKNITTQMQSIEDNLTEIIKMFTDVDNNFSQLNYKKGGN